METMGKAQRFSYISVFHCSFVQLQFEFYTHVQNTPENVNTNGWILIERLLVLRIKRYKILHDMDLCCLSSSNGFLKTTLLPHERKEHEM